MKEKTVVIPNENVDTDQIIPARFLKGTSRDGLGKHCFADWKEKPSRDGTVLVAGKNFGCGSSREHAVWALMDCGYKAVVSTKIADIFRNNALKNGLLPIEVDEDTLKNLGDEVTINLEAKTINGVPFPIDPFAHYRLLRGIDELQHLLDQEHDIAAYEREKS